MNGLAIIGMSLAGGAIGFFAGGYIGEIKDHGDLPLGGVFGAFTGTPIGLTLGTVIGALLFA